MRAILLSRKDFKRSAADEAAGRPPVDDARWREVPTYTFTLLPTACYTCYLLLANLPPATCHLPTTYWREVCDLDEAAAVLREWGAL